MSGFGKQNKGQILRETQGITLGTLANNTVLKADGQLAVQEDFRILKAKAIVTMKGLTAGQYPVDFGIADNELSVGEIAETLSLDGPLDRNDHDGQEKTMRPVFRLGTFVTDSDGQGSGTDGSVSNVKLDLPRWTFSDTEGWTWWAYNRSGGALTTGAIISIAAEYFGVWVT